MKFRLIIFLYILTIKFCFAQSDTIYFNSEWKKCNSTDAKYYRITSVKENIQIVTDYYSNGIPQMIAEVISIEPLIKEGRCSYFDEKGVKTSEGNYTNNRYEGKWIKWENNGKDSSITDYNDEYRAKNYAPATRENGETVYTMVENMPSFLGGQDSLLSYISQHIKYPKTAQQDNIQGKVFVRFIVSKSGDVVDVKVARGIRNDLDEAALRVIKEMPRWEPGQQNGQLVNVTYLIPINFTLSEKKKQ